MRFRIEIRQEMIESANVWILARRDLVQWRIFNGESAVPHRTRDMYDGMAGCASQPGLGFRRVDLFTDRTIETPVEEHRMIVTSGAPFARLGADRRLHVLNRF